MNVLIATHGRPTLLERTLECLTTVRLPGALRQIILVENGSDAGARQVCAAFRDRLPLAYHHREQAGKSRALQWAIDQLLDDGLIVFLDDDVRLPPWILESYASAGAAHGPGHYFGGPVDIDYEQQPPAWLMKYLPPSAKGWRPQDPDQELQRARFLGFNYAAFTADIRAVGGFDLAIGPGANRPGSEGNPLGDETELQDRLYAHGCRPIWLAEALVHHYVPADRCSPQWALHRAYRNSMGMAMRDPEDRHTGSPRLFGVPRWMLPRYAARWLAAQWVRWWPISPQRRFEVQWREANLRGQMAGVRSRLARQAAAPPTAASEGQAT
jgi:glycosyltransferase involved in cell wall biosynthesis